MSGVCTNEMKQKATDEKKEKNGEKMSARMKIKTEREKNYIVNANERIRAAA